MIYLEDSRSINQKEIINEFESIKLAAEFVGVNPSSITRAVKGIQKRAKSYYWKLKNN